MDKYEKGLAAIDELFANTTTDEFEQDYIKVEANIGTKVEVILMDYYETVESLAEHPIDMGYVDWEEGDEQITLDGNFNKKQLEYLASLL